MLEQAIRELRADKAAGFDGIGAELLKFSPAEMAMKLHPLLVKSAVRGQWPAEFSGGWILPLHKKGNSKLMTNYRAILLEPTIARAFSKSWRPILVKGLSNVASLNHWGGKKGLGISSMHLQVRLWQQNAAKAKRSISLIFLDLKSAFYTVSKPLLAGWDGQRDSLLKLCQCLKVPGHAMEAFITHVSRGDLIWKATGSRTVSNMVTASLARTWFVVPNSENICSPQTGSRPGDPLADILFSYMMAEILDLLQERLHEAGLLESCRDDQLLHTQMVTWVDDVAFGLTSDATHLCEKTIQAFSIVYETMTEFGMTLSFGPGKSAVIMRFAGKHAIQSRQEAEKTYAQHLPVLNEYGPVVKIPIVSHYKHLGGFITRNAAILPEIRVRSAQVLQRIQPLRRILKDKRLDACQRRLLIKSIAVPILTLHCGTWSNVNKMEFQSWSGAVFKIYTMLNSRDEDGSFHPVTMYKAANEMGCAMPMELLHINKMRLAIQIMEHGDDAMHSAVIHNARIAGEESWVAGIKRSLVWVEEQTGDTTLAALCGDLCEFVTWKSLKNKVKHLRKCLKTAERAHMLRVRTMTELQNADRLQRQIFIDMGWKVENTEDPLQQEQTIFECTICHETFETGAGLSVHEQKKHGRRAAIRRFVTNGACLICRRYYHTRARAIQRLHYGRTGCWFRLMRWLKPMDDEQVALLDQEACQQSEAWHHHGLTAHHKDKQWRMCHEDELIPALVEIIPRNQVSDHLPEQHELDAWCSLGFLPTGEGGRDVTVRKPKEWQIFNAVEDAANYERHMKDEVKTWTCDDSWVPMPLKCNARFYLVFFSGHRRLGDVSCWIQWTSDIVPINVDTAVHGELGNMFNVGFWVHLIRSGLVIGGHGGPPCETYTLARWNVIPGMEDAPRPLRSSSHPWGIPFRRIREVQQMVAGSVLMMNTLSLLLLIYFCGGCMTLEHPHGPGENAIQWGIWQSSFVKRFLLLPQVSLVPFIQGPLGTDYTKPTIFHAREIGTSCHFHLWCIRQQLEEHCSFAGILCGGKGLAHQSSQSIPIETV